MQLTQASAAEKTPKKGGSSAISTESAFFTAPKGKPLAKWMKFVLRFAAVFNICAGLFMLIGYHETYKIIGMEKPNINFPMQLVGILVGLFGVGYYLVARNPIENRAVLMLGFWSKFLGSCLGTGYVILGKIDPQFVAVYFFADVIYLPFFFVILKRLYALARDADSRR
jgi:hypothetical protein